MPQSVSFKTILMDFIYFNVLEQALKHGTCVISELPPFHRVVYALSVVLVVPRWDLCPSLPKINYLSNSQFYLPCFKVRACNAYMKF